MMMTCCEWIGVIEKLFSFFDPIIQDTELSFLIERDDRYNLCIEHLTDLISQKLVDGLDFKIRCKSFLHTVDDGKLCSTLLGLLEQTLCLVEETGVFEGGA